MLKINKKFKIIPLFFPLLLLTSTATSCAAQVNVKVMPILTTNPFDNGIKNIDDLAFNDSIDSATSNKIDYLPSSFIYDMNNSVITNWGYANTQNWDEVTNSYKDGEYKWDVGLIDTEVISPKDGPENPLKGNVNNTRNVNINTSITNVSLHAYNFSAYFNIILSYLFQTGITMGKNHNEWYSEFFGKRLGGGFNPGEKKSQEIIDWYSLVLSIEQLLFEGNHSLGFGVYKSDFKYSNGGMYGPAFYVSKDNYTNFIDEVTTDPTHGDDQPYYSMKGTNEYMHYTVIEEKDKDSGALSYKIDNPSVNSYPFIVNAPEIGFGYYDFKATPKFDPVNNLITDNKKIKSILDTSTSWKSKSIVDAVGQKIDKYNSHYLVSSSKNPGDLPKIGNDKDFTNGTGDLISELNFKTNSFISFNTLYTKYAIQTDAQIASNDPKVVQVTADQATDLYPAWVLYKIKDSANLDNFTLADVELDPSILVDDEYHSDITEKKYNIISKEKVDKKFSKYFINFYANSRYVNSNDKPFDKLNDEEKKDRIYSMMFVQCLFGNFNGNQAVTTNASDIVSAS